MTRYTVAEDPSVLERASETIVQALKVGCIVTRNAPKRLWLETAYEDTFSSEQYGFWFAQKGQQGAPGLVSVHDSARPTG